MSLLSSAELTARQAKIRARQARRKELKPLLREVLVPHNLPEVLIPSILTWVGYDLIHDFPGVHYYQRDAWRPALPSESDTIS